MTHRLLSFVVSLAICLAASACTRPHSSSPPPSGLVTPTSPGPSLLCSRLPEVDQPVGTVVGSFHLGWGSPTALLPQIAAGRRAAVQLAAAAASAGERVASTDFLKLVARLDSLTGGIQSAGDSPRFTKRLRHLAGAVGAALTTPAIDMRCPLTF
jgi:hypothetical protein